MSNHCHYGCWFGGRCMGATLEQIRDWYADEMAITDEEARAAFPEGMTDDEVYEELSGRFDVDYSGPSHLKAEGHES